MWIPLPCWTNVLIYLFNRDPNFMDNFIHCTNHVILLIKKMFEGLSNNKAIHKRAIAQFEMGKIKQNNVWTWKFTSIFTQRKKEVRCNFVFHQNGGVKRVSPQVPCITCRVPIMCIVFKKSRERVKSLFYVTLKVLCDKGLRVWGF